MLRNVRRVVTGLNAQGRSTVLFEGDVGNVVESPRLPGLGVTLLWVSDALPADNRGTADAAARPFQIQPPKGGASFLMVEYPPHATGDALSPHGAPAALSLPTHGRTQGAHPGMHATDSVEYSIMLRGELTLLLEEREVTLRAGDTLVNRGVEHAWENRGSEPAVKAVIMLDALPLQTS